MNKVFLSGSRTTLDIRAGKKGTPYYPKGIMYKLCIAVAIIVPVSIVLILGLAFSGVDLI